MLVRFFLWFLSFFNPFHGPVDPDQPYEVTRYGPQSWREAVRASEALHGNGDDIRYIDEPSHAGINSTNSRWPGYPGGAIIPYFLTPDVKNDGKLVKLIKETIAEYEKKTCLRFKEAKNEKDYIRIFKDGSKCYSYVGKIHSYYQPQNMSLGPGCEYKGTVVHEFGHALGLYHEHQRSDRDDHLNVYKNNVADGEWHNFEKTNKTDEMTFGAKYDYTSIMHYGECAFSKNPRDCPKNKKLWTMEAKDGTRLKEPYDREGLNSNDVALIKKLYKCK